MFLNSQTAALYALFNATNGPNWNWKLPESEYGLIWNFSNPSANPCSNWQGVDCDASDNSSITGIYLHSYELYGTIPNTFCNISSLKYLDLSDNSVFGTLSDSFDTLKLLEYFNISSNELTGTLPSFSSLSVLDLSDNILYGPFQGNYGNISILLLNDNNFDSISSTVDLSSIVIFQAENNIMSGTLPLSIANSKVIQELIVTNNILSGPITYYFADHQTDLHVVDLGTNQFTGSIPNAAFASPVLEYFSVSSNCLGGSLPSNICNPPNLTTLAMSGSGSASSCHRPLFDSSVIKTFISENLMTGSIPKCLLESSKLQYLILSGASFDGTIDSDVTVGASMIELQLSNNRLMGVLPASIQHHSWETLDLSYNKLKGVLDSSIPTPQENSSLYLQSNRFSGFIPNSLLNAHVINILQANSFDCRFVNAQQDLPRRDPEYATYHSCGSNSFYITLIQWFAFVLLLFVVVMVAWFRCRSFLRELLDKCRKWRVALDQSSSLRNVKRLLSWLVVWFLSITLFLLCVMMPIYYSLTNLYGTQTYRYGWVLSLAYINGIPVGYVTMALLYVTMLASGLFIRSISKDIRPSTREEIKFSVSSKPILVMIVFLCINLGFVTVINIYYVYAALQYTSNVVQIAQLGMSFFKLGWNSVVVRWSLRYVLQLQLSLLTTNTGSLPYSIWLSRFETAIVLFNNIISPFFATAIMSSVCFYNTLIVAQEVVTTVPRPSIFGSQVVTSIYEPGFTYSYQCSSSYITTYAPVYIFMFITIAFLSPMLQIACVYLETKLDVNSELMRLLCMLQPKYLQSLHVLRHNDNLCESVAANGNTATMSNYVFMIVTRRRKILQGDLFVVRLVSMFAILLTFGAAVPIVAVTGLVAMISFAYFNQLALGRFVTQISESDIDSDKEYLKKLEEDAKFIPECFIRCIMIVTPFILIFYPTILVDVIGDQHGWVNGLNFAIFSVGVPSSIFVFRLIQLQFARNKQSVEENQVDMKEINNRDVVIVSNPILEKDGDENL